MKKITITFDGEKTTVESEGYPGMSCLHDLDTQTMSLVMKTMTKTMRRTRMINPFFGGAKCLYRNFAYREDGHSRKLT